MPLYFLKISFAIFSSKENHLNSYYFIAIQTAPSCIKLQDKGTVSVNPKKNKGTVLLSLEALRLLLEIVELLIIIVDTPQGVKGVPEGKGGVRYAPRPWWVSWSGQKNRPLVFILSR